VRVECDTAVTRVQPAIASSNAFLVDEQGNTWDTWQNLGFGIIVCGARLVLREEVDFVVKK
jgi:hypothetical protein